MMKCLPLLMSCLPAKLLITALTAGRCSLLYPQTNWIKNLKNKNTMQRMPPVVLNLIIINVIVFILTGILIPNLSNYVPLFYPYPGPESLFKPYQLVTYMFAHGGFWHIALNMFALWMFGSQIENVWGGKK